MTRSSVTTPPPGAGRLQAAPGGPAPGSPLGSHYGDCFGCGERHPTGLHLRATTPDGLTVVAEFTVGEAHQGAPGLAHGGVLAAAMDEVIGMSVWLFQRPYVTGRLETDYLAPVPVGTTLHLRAWCTGVSGRKAYLEAEGRAGSPDGPVAVRAAALFIEVGMEHFARHGDAKAIADEHHEYEVNP
ncbi:acyl-coenzyme A thioesterase PaaI-like protein [Streptosporangium becharense]|uniref:Acyl-coenzyme A thioesterase THEM4 n=1 Tax=Streptosporangium becharense TaxID=1816182 RepID=A0A7W9MIL9_9ACTN|nr:PaaI family thioesterase [Streptosporangium becharense]MBB2911825.1 acyl-coenzyme A thioesterase PaaI-like protein [Streptosporangium becharense]MBB5822357.1 acyl-coenzyme A thioesterase PaaI-like protein [Streptosporangium becharense]